jgi:hypothetical protein
MEAENDQLYDHKRRSACVVLPCSIHRRTFLIVTTNRIHIFRRSLAPDPGFQPPCSHPTVQPLNSFPVHLKIGPSFLCLIQHSRYQASARRVRSSMPRLMELAKQNSDSNQASAPQHQTPAIRMTHVRNLAAIRNSSYLSIPMEHNLCTSFQIQFVEGVQTLYPHNEEIL